MRDGRLAFLGCGRLALAMAVKSRPTPDADDSAFAEAMRGVKVLGGPRRVVPDLVRADGAAAKKHLAGVQARRARALSPPAPRDLGSAADAASGGRRPAGGAAAGATDRTGDAEAGTGTGTEQWHLRAAGIDRRTVKRLRAGEVTIEARLDLHGLTRSRAIDALERFLAAARASQRRGLLVIHGRGLHSGADGPTLTHVVREALAHGVHADAVLAAVPAPPRLGGVGATLVWLRRA
jgi:DNA-nicking Smr family endonuclease